MDLYLRWQKLHDENPRSDELAELIIHHGAEILEYVIKLKPKRTYRYMITFTVDPKKISAASKDTQDSIESYIIRQVRRHSDVAYIAKEHATSNVHWHVVLTRKMKLKYNEFNYYKTHYGNIDISLSKTESLEDGLKYISKETTPLQIK